MDRDTHITPDPGTEILSPLKEGGAVIPLPPWGLYAVFVVLAAAYVLVPLIVVNGLRIAFPFIKSIEEFAWMQSVTMLSCLALFTFMSFYYRVDVLYFLGLRPERPANYYLWQSLMAFLALSVIIVLFTLSANHFGLKSQQAAAPLQGNELYLYIIFAVMMAPVLEEIIFRGMIQAAFLKYVSPLWTVLLTCILFTVVHGTDWNKPLALIYIFLSGLVLGIWRQRTGSLIPGMVAHFGNNLMASVLLLMRGHSLL